MDMMTESLTPAFLKFVTAQCLRSWNLKSLIPALRQAFVKAVLMVLDALAPVGENIGASQGPGYPFEEANKRLRQRYFPFLLGLGVRGFQGDDLVFEVHLVPPQAQDFPLPHARPISQLRRWPEVRGAAIP